MRLTLHRQGTVKAFETVLTMESMSSERDDIVELLQYIHANGSVVKEELLSSKLGDEIPSNIITGIVEHLKKIDLLNPNGTISIKGKKVVETELVPIEERGQFFTYYLQDDILKNYLLHYERINEKGRRKRIESTEYLDSNLFKNISYTSIINKKEFKIKQFDGVSNLSRIVEDSGTYQLIWEIDLEKERPSTMYLTGELKNPYDKSFRFVRQNILNKEYEYSIELLNFLVDQAKSEEMDWNAVSGYLEVPLDILPIENYEQLITSLKIPKQNLGSIGSFEATEISAIPIGPKNNRDARKWICLLVEKYLEDGYKNKFELLIFLMKLKEVKVFQNYHNVIDDLNVNNFIEDLKLKNSTAYWNLQTPIDLFSNVDDRYIVHNRKVDISSGTSMSMMDLVNEIAGNEEPEVLVFSSKYVNNPAQIRKFEAFVKAFQTKGVRDIVLVTKEVREFEIKEIKVELYNDVYVGSIHPHDRYLAYKSKGIWHRFKMTAELDQCRYDNWRELTENTKGKWEDISFYEILPEIFPEKLNERLNLVEEVHYL